MNRTLKITSRKLTAVFTMALMMTACLMIVPSVSASTASPEWQSATDTGANFTHAMSVQIGDLVYIIGGTDNTTTYRAVNSTYSYSLATGQWHVLADMPQAIRDGAAATDGDNIYVFGGDTANGNYVGVVQIYGIANDTWYYGTEMPTGAIESKAAFWNEAVHVIGGYNYSAGGYLALDQIYDPITDSWSIGNPIPEAKFGGSIAVVNDALVYIGGAHNWYATGDTYIQWPGSNWTVASPAPDNFTAAGTTVGADGLVYILGGAPYDIYSKNFNRTLWYDIEMDSWGYAKELPGNRTFASAASTDDGRIFVLGGDNQTKPYVSVCSLQVMTLTASVLDPTVNSGEDVSVSIAVSFAYRTVNYFEGTARLIASGGNVLAVQAFDSVDSSDLEFKISVPEDALSGEYAVNIERVRVHELNDRTFLIGVNDLAVDVTHVPSEQEQIDAMNEDLNGQINDSNDRIEELENDVDTLNSDLDEKASTTMMLIALVIALAGVLLAVVAILLIRRK